MKHLLILIVGLALPVGVRAAQWNPFDSSSADKSAITKLEQDWAAMLMKNDAAGVQNLGTPDCILMDSDGQNIAMKQIVADMKSGAATVKSMHIDDLKIRVYGDTALAFGLETEKSKYHGKNTSGQYRFIDTWVKRNGHWLCAASADALVKSKK